MVLPVTCVCNNHLAFAPAPACASKITSVCALLCVCVCVQVAAAEQQLNDLMVSLQQELSGACIKFSQHRIFGVFLITNARQVGLYYF